MTRSTFLLVFVLGTCAFLVTGERASAERQLRIGYVTDAGLEPNRSDLFGLPYDGFIRAVKKLGVEGRAVQVAPNQDATGALSLLARQRYDLVIMGVADPAALAVVAHDYPRTRFLLPDFPVPAPGRDFKNVQGTVFRSEQAGYLAGYLAALMERRRPGRDVISSVGGQRFQGVDRWIVGYRAGAKKADPGIVTATTYANSFTNPRKCKAVALDQIAKGAGAIFNVAGGCGFGALEAAREKGVWGIGVDVDQSYLGPHILTSAVNRVDVAVYSAIQRLVHGTFTTGGNSVFNLKNGGVGLGKISPRVPPAVLRQLGSVRRQIVVGKIHVRGVI